MPVLENSTDMWQLKSNSKAAKVDSYPIPKIKDLFAKVAGAKKFSILDLSRAYQQVQLDKQSRKYGVINTHRGLFQYNCLPYGISSALGIFQRVMESLLKDIPGVVVYIDNILITGNDEEHLATLEKVLDCLQGFAFKGPLHDVVSQVSRT